MDLLEQYLAAGREAERIVPKQDDADDYQTEHGKRVDPVEPTCGRIPYSIRSVLLGWRWIHGVITCCAMLLVRQADISPDAGR